MTEYENRSYDMEIRLTDKQRVSFSITVQNIEKEVAEKCISECEAMTDHIKKALAG